jgi:hypothetical protein
MGERPRQPECRVSAICAELSEAFKAPLVSWAAPITPADNPVDRDLAGFLSGEEGRFRSRKESALPLHPF